PVLDSPHRWESPRRSRRNAPKCCRTYPPPGRPRSSDVRTHTPSTVRFATSCAAPDPTRGLQGRLVLRVTGVVEGRPLGVRLDHSSRPGPFRDINLVD